MIKFKDLISRSRESKFSNGLWSTLPQSNLSLRTGQITLTLACVAFLTFWNGRIAHADLILDFTNSQATYGPAGSETYSNLSNDNNLEIRWGSIGNVLGTDVDLVATVSGDNYAASNEVPAGGWPSGFNSRVYTNGLSGSATDNFRFGRINLRNDHAATFTFTLMETGTNTAVQADFAFSVLDLDTGLDMDGGTEPLGGMESVQLISQDGAATWRTSVNTELSSTYTPTNPPASWSAPVITATTPFFGATTPGTGADNPTDPFNLTEQQANRTVLFNFENTSSFQLRLGIGPDAEGGSLGGRNFLFGGGATVPEPSSAMMFGLAVGFALRRRRRNAR